jgi:hypothetical protein
LITNTDTILGKKIVIFGTGNAAQQVYEDLSINFKINFFLDNDNKKWGCKFNGIDIKSPDFLLELTQDNIIIIIASMYYREISGQLQSMDLIEHFHFINSKELYQNQLQNLLDRILYKYDFNYEIHSSVFEKCMFHKINMLEASKKVAIWGDEEHTGKIIELLVGRCNEVVRVVEHIAEKDDRVNDDKVIVLNNIENQRVEVIILTTMNNRDKIKQEIKKMSPAISIIDIYDIYDNVISSDELISFFKTPYAHYNVWIEIHVLRNLIVKEKDIQFLDKLYHWLLSYLLLLRDFNQFENIIKQYSHTKLLGREQAMMLKEEVFQLLDYAKSRIFQRQQKDFIVFIFDAMRQQDIVLTPALNKLAKRSMTFSSAFSPSTYTRACFIGMLTSLRPDGNSFEDRSINGHDSSSLKWLTDHEYRVYQHGGPVIDNVRSLKRVGDNNPNVLTSKLWEVNCRLFSMNEPQFHLIHAMETHYPFLCVEHQGVISKNYQPIEFLKGNDNKSSEIIKQYNQVLMYISDTLDKAFTWMSKSTTLIVTSDHGGAVGGVNPTGHLTKCDEEYIHVPLIIFNERYVPQNYNELFSMSKFDALLNSLFVSDKFNVSLFSSYILVERDPIYNLAWRNETQVIEKLGDWILGFKMVRDREYKYVLFENGNERFYKLPDEKMNLIFNNSYTEMISNLKSKISTDFSMYSQKTKSE